MRTHEHALISLGYAAGIAFLAKGLPGPWGQGLADPWLYLSALVGGELIDFIDHPLYHLVYNRNEPHVVEARKAYREKGFKAATEYLNDVEDNRQFKGLLLHNVYTLSLVAIVAIVLSLFLPAPVYWFVGLGAFFLHMLTDIYGDFIILGHADNWLWVLSDPVLKWLGNKGTKLLNLIMVWGAFVLMSFLVIGFRIGWQISLPLENPNTSLMRAILAAPDLGWLAYVPLLGLSAYHLALLTLGAGAYHKYQLEIGRKPTDTHYKRVESLKYLLLFVQRRIPLNHRNAEIALLKMQADQEAWILICAALILVSLTIFTLLGWTTADNYWILVLPPIFLALLFGTFIHTTIGEFGGVLGVLSAWLLNLLLGALSPALSWGIGKGYIVFFAAIGAWVLGLLGGILLKGQSRMSLVVFSIHLRCHLAETKDDDWIKDILISCREGLDGGYIKTHAQLFPSAPKKSYLLQQTTDLMVAPYQGNPILGTDYFHLEADDAYIPILRELEYVLCENRITSGYEKSKRFFPVMPRYRSFGKIEDGDLFWRNGKYHWKSQRRPLELASAASSPNLTNDNSRTWILSKTRDEILDHLVTKRSGIHTDLFVYPPVDPQDGIIVCGIVRESTSTKEYATVEAEAYAGNVLAALKKKFMVHDNVEIVEDASARLFYPRISFYDSELLSWAENLAVLPSDQSGFPRKDLSFLRKSLDALPVKNLIPSATANFRNKLMVLGGEYLLSTVLTTWFLKPTQDINLDNLIKNGVNELAILILKKLGGQ